ncbi:AAA family ATPase [Dinghuibacter silviterrae]|uniref:NadR type nicotinamide-nucleotide adenylyltransferase n=1 Tax=Dinghuibacter silviterrae TaxID=1539049 RepID=A0A4R8DQB2_9BACT|nr:ATP-binding protein [Dinghuibacter silviterrae]TDW99584.1 NadR type nicotinamide-nucleotide adenylyltransferase [Dinghuibacter silviterrae]
MLKKIVAIGPESTGKSTLCEMLAQHYRTAWVPEYAREFLLKRGPGTPYSLADLDTIARGQLDGEDKYALSLLNNADFAPFLSSDLKEKLLFIDTDMYVMKVWGEYVFDQCPPYVLEQIVQRKYDLYLLCNVDLPWVRDELREYPDLETRQQLYYIYKDIMVNQKVPWVDISGGPEERLERAIAGVEKYALGR